MQRSLSRRLPASLNVVNVIGVVIVAVVLVYLVPRVGRGGSDFLVRILIIGVTTGAVYALIALGYTMVYGIIELINFAHGDVFTLGAFISLPLLAVFGLTEGTALGLAQWLRLGLVFLITMLITGTINVGIERFAYRPLRNAPRLAPLITAVGMSFLLEGAMYVWKGAVNLHYPDLLPDSSIALGPASIRVKDVVVVAAAIGLVIGLGLFISRSKLGKAMRATAQDRDAAQLMGINIDRTISATFFIGAVLAGAGGIIYGLYINSVNNTLGFTAGLYAFTAAVFGGIGNIPGAALGGLMIGIISAVSDGYGPNTSLTSVWVFAVLILVLTLRPTGLLGMRVPEK